MTARVLVVDDLRPNVKLLEAKLLAEYFEVITASDGPSALIAVNEHNPDIILLDVMMPGMDGFEVCQTLKNNPATMHIPIVMVTALSDSADRVRGLESGADDFLTKPVNDRALFARVRSLIRVKLLNDELRLRQETSDQFGPLNEQATVQNVDVDNPHILIVDDSLIERKKITDILSQKPSKIDSVASIAEAYDILQTTHYELIILNLQMRDDDALRFASRLRANDNTRSLPILILSDEGEIERMAKGLDLGINDYVMKPVDRNELIARTRTQIRRQRYQEKLKQNYEHSLAMALTDSLTGVYNRRYVTAHLGAMIDRHLSSRKHMSLALFDIDYFKGVNDTFGHPAGDEVLIELTKRIVNDLRNVDLVARIGGEEFVVVMPDTDFETASQVADRLRQIIAQEKFKISDQEEALSITISIGITGLKAEEDHADDMLKRADAALYFAKSQQRNTVAAVVDSEFKVIGKGAPAVKYTG